MNKKDYKMDDWFVLIVFVVPEIFIADIQMQNVIVDWHTKTPYSGAELKKKLC